MSWEGRTLDGWIKLHRKITEWEWYTDINTYKLFTHLLFKAYTSDTKFMGQLFKRGDVFTKIPDLSRETGLSIQEVRTCIKRLVGSGDISTKSTNKFTVIKVLNYSVYQDVTKPEQHSTNIQSTNNQHPINILSTCLDKEYKEGKEDKEYIKDIVGTTVPTTPKKKSAAKAVKTYPPDSVAYLSVAYLVKKILERNPNAKVPTDDQGIYRWCTHIDYILRIDKKPKDELREVLKFATSDSFWSTNILSTAKLREKYDTLFMQMNREKAGSRDDKQVGRNSKPNRFVNYEQRQDWDFEALEKMDREFLESEINEEGGGEAEKLQS